MKGLFEESKTTEMGKELNSTRENTLVIRSVSILRIKQKGIIFLLYKGVNKPNIDPDMINMEMRECFASG